MDLKYLKSQLKHKEVCIFYTKRMIAEPPTDIISKTMQNQLLRLVVEIEEIKKAMKHKRKKK